MKSLLLIFVFGLAAATDEDFQRGFRPGHEYEYHYDAQLMTGMPNTATNQAGFRFRCNARLQFVPSTSRTIDEVRVIFEDIIFYRLNRPVKEGNIHQRLLPVEHLKELTGMEALEMEKYLLKPFSFHYFKGTVWYLRFSGDDVSWSMNIKRGLASLFQMNLHGIMQLRGTERREGRTQWYDVIENSAGGYCVTLYTISPTNQNNTKYVTKTRDLSQCLLGGAHPEFKSIFENQPKSDYLKDEPLVREANMKYSVRGDADDFLIVSAISENRVFFSPYKNQGEVMTSVNQTLFLKHSKALAEPVVIPNLKLGDEKANNLRMRLPSEAADPKDVFGLTDIEDDEPEQQPKEERADVYSAEKIKMHLELAIQDTMRLTSQQSLTHLKVVIDMLKTSPRRIIEELLEQLKTTDPSDQLRLKSYQVLWKILPVVATNASANVVLDKCRIEHLTAENCALAVNKLALRANPTISIMYNLMSLINRTQIRPMRPAVKQAAYLALGSLTYRMLEEKKRQNEELNREADLLKTLKRDPIRTIRNRVRDLKRAIGARINKIANTCNSIQDQVMETFKALLRSPILDDRVLALKSIGNSGLEKAIPTLKEYLINTTENNILRVMAVTAFRRIDYPKEARQETIYTLREKIMDTKDRSEIRNLAFEIMAGLKPDLPTYETIADSLRTEKNEHVSSFILSYFRTYANTTYPPYWDIQKNMTAALLLAPTEELPDSSVYRQYTKFNEDYKLGATWSLSTLGDRYGYKGAALSMDTYILGYLSQFAEIGVNTEGIREVLERLFGPEGILTDKKSFIDLLRSLPRNPQDIIDAIFEKLNIKPRTSPSPYGHLYFKMMGDELRYLTFTEALKDILKGESPITIDNEGVDFPIDINTMYDHMETQLTLPCEAGIPIALKLQSASAVNIQGHVDLKIVPLPDSLPESITTEIKIAPKITIGVQGSMGLDMFYYKPIVGFNILLKSQVPLETTVVFEPLKTKLKIIQYMFPSVEPLVESLIEPFSQLTVIPVEEKNPILVLPTQQVFASYGARVYPIGKEISLNRIGYKMALTGQIPQYVSLHNPFLAMSGRTLFNVFLKPLDDAPKKLVIDAQYLHYRPNERKDNEEENENDLQDEDELDPGNLDDVEPARDPVDLSKTTVTVPQLTKTFQRLSGRAQPLDSHSVVHGLVMSLDASTEDVRRKFQMESLWASTKQRQYNVVLMRLWRSAIPGIDDKTWQALIQSVFVLPFEIFEPKDVFDPQQQTLIMNELQYLISVNAHRVINQIMNVTVLSIDEQLNYPSMVNLPIYQVIDRLVPEQLYKLLNMTGTVIHRRRWEDFWESLMPLYARIQQENRIDVERFNDNRDAQFLEILDRLIGVQHQLMYYIGNMQTSHNLIHAELPIMQDINTIQMKSVYEMELIVAKAEKRHQINDHHLIHQKLQIVKDNVNVITDEAASLLELIGDVRSNVQIPRIIADLQASLNKMAHDQMQVNKKIEHHVHFKTDFDYKILEDWAEQAQRNITFLDSVLKDIPIYNERVRETVLLVTVQNEMMNVLLEEWQKVYNKLHEPSNDIIKSNQLEKYILAIKTQGMYLAERSALLYRSNLQLQVVVPQLNSHEKITYVQNDQLLRRMMVENRVFEIGMAYNVTTMRDFEAVQRIYNAYNVLIDQHIAKAAELQEIIKQHIRMPKVYLVSELINSIGYMKRMVEFARRTLLSLKEAERLVWVKDLDRRATAIQGLVASMAPIFNKYNHRHIMPRTQHSVVLPRVPISARVLDVKEVMVEQKLLRDELLKFIGNTDVSKAILSKVLLTAIGRAEALLTTLKRSHQRVLDAMEERSLYQGQPISAIYSRALTRQNLVFKILREALENRRADIDNVDEMQSRISRLVSELDDLVHEKDNKEEDMQQPVQEVADGHQNAEDERRGDAPVNESDPWYSQIGLIHGVEGFINITWGNNYAFDKDIKLELLASRTDEQMLYIYKQMNGILRNPVISDAVNHALSGELWKNKDALLKLNSYNHLHLIAHYNEKTVPDVIVRWGKWFDDYLKAKLWDYYTYQQPFDFVPRQQIHAMLDISDVNQQFDFYLLDPRETNKFIGVADYQPTKCIPFTQPLKFTKPRLFAKKCVMNKKKMFTIDKVFYQLDHFLDTPTLLAMDCSPDKEFAITVQESNTTFEGISLRILTKDHEIRIVTGSMQVQVTIDGKVIDLKDNVPQREWKQDKNGRWRESYWIVRRGLKVELELSMSGLFFFVEKRYIEIEVSPFYQDKVCGLCGNYDSQMSWELEGPREQVFNTSYRFVDSYVIPDDSRAETRRSGRQKGGDGQLPRQEQQQEQQLQQGPFCKPYKQTELKRKSEYDCFSLKPLLNCPFGCHGHPREEKVWFVCFKHDDPRAIIYRKELLEGSGVINFDHLGNQGKRIRIKVFTHPVCERP